jgi:hypothetical protein
MNTDKIEHVVSGGLLVKALPKVIETVEELERFAEIMESLDLAERRLTREEGALQSLLARLIQDMTTKSSYLP